MAPYLGSPSPSCSPDNLTPFEEILPFETLPASAVEPIAICGIGLRLPGGISTPAQFWDFLINKGDARGPVPPSRYNVSSYHSKSGKPGHVKATHGYFLDESVDLGALDTSFFTMPKQEIERADPQQRLLLEVARECLDSAGETDYRGKNIGTYVGTFGEDWLENFSKDSQGPATYKLTGYGDFVLSNRISYEYDLKGPSMTIKTGCSSALIGLHEACMAIRAGECNAAIVGGANLILTPTVTICMSDQGVLSPDGSCKTFDAAANGYARGEAINAVYIKKLCDAIRDKNPIRAIIRGSSSNADGKTAGLSVPSFECHEAMIRRAYQVAGISDVSRTGFVECHGTGTPTGDPIETTAVANVFGEHGVYIGSVKPNVGHSEGASGMTSLIKSVLALEHQTIPPNIKFKKPNPKIPFSEKKLKVPVEPTAWPADRCERASINSFGIGGSNIHVILDSAKSFLGPSTISNGASATISRPQLVAFTANTADSLRREVVNQQRFIAANPTLLNDIAYTLGARRSHLPHRAFSIIGDGIETNTSSFSKTPLKRPELVMIFTGQGAQWPQMGAELLESNQVFAETIRQMDQTLSTLPDPPPWSIIDELQKPAETSRLHLASISQPLCTAVQIALVAVLQDIGVRPYAVVGHSSGEMAAAYAAGKLSQGEAIIAAYYRGVVSGEVTEKGSMAAIGMGWRDTSEYLIPGVVIACENSPSSVTISGDQDKVHQVLSAIQRAKPDCLARPLKVDKAYHSHHMKEVGDRYASLASKYVRETSRPGVKPIMFSSVTGKLLRQDDHVDARYWQANLESPVLFRTAVANLVETHGKHASNGLVFLEVGPHSALAGPLRQTLAQASLDCPYSSCLVRSKNATQTFLSAIGQLWTQAVPADFCRLTDPLETARVIDNLPTYPWQHDHSHLFGTRLTREWRFRKFPKHELLGIRVAESTDNEPLWRNVLALDQAPWIRDHNIKGDVIFPCAGYVGMIGEAARQVFHEDFAGFSLRNFVIDTAMVLNNSKSIEIMTSFNRHRLTDSLDSAWYDFVVSSHNGTAWMKHCAGQVCARSSPAVEEQETSLKRLPRSVDAAKWYQALRTVGANYGPYFQGLRDVSCSTTEHVSQGFATNTVHDDEVEYAIHPTKIDFFLQLFSVASLNGVARKVGKMNVPTFIQHMDVFKCDAELEMRIEAEQTRRGAIFGGGEAYGPESQIALRVAGVRLSPLEGEVSQENQDPHAGARIFWEPSFDFRQMSSLITPHPDQAIYMPLCQEMGLLSIQECLRVLKGVETTIPHLQKFRSWMERQPLPSMSVDIKAVAVQLENTVMKPFAIGLMKIVENIVPMFKGDVEPIEVLMPDKTLTNIYDGLNLADRKAMYQSLGHYKADLRVLELGAGTGGTTNRLLEGLVGNGGHRLYSRYTYTDISAGFFVAAKERFKNYAGMEFRTLDISRDPVEQGFEPASYDLIVGANVLHVTDSLKETLAGIRKLLKPDGRLYMEELCCEVKTINIIMGVLPGWWLGGPDGRPDEPYVYPDRWDQELRAAGFMGADDVALDCDKPNQLVAYIMAKPAVDCVRERHLTLWHDEAALNITEELARTLVTAGYRVELFDCANGLPPLGNDIIVTLDVLTPFLEDISNENFQIFRDLMAEASKYDSGVFWLTRSSQVNCTDPRWAQIIGAARTIRADVGLELVTCEIDKVDSKTWPLISKIVSEFHMRTDENTSILEQEYAIVNGEVLIPRMYPVVVNHELRQAEGISQNVAYDLIVGQYGRLSSLQWTPRAERVLIGDEVLVEPKSVGMNFKDVLVAMGIVETATNNIGLEASGIVRRVGPEAKRLKPGDRVFLIGDLTFTTAEIMTEKVCVKIPDSLSFDDAATMPAVFGTVIYGLLDIGRLERGQTVLIHSACGGVGLAAIQICRMVGAEFYCTVSNETKVRYLVEGLGVPRDNIFNSRDASFLPALRKATNDRGADLVLNSLSGELLHASWDCVAEFGKMIEISKRDLIGNGTLALNPFLLNRSYCGIDFGHLSELRPMECNRLLSTVVKLYEEGHITPIRPIQTFSAATVQDCFRFMQKGQHIGKIVVSLDAEEIKAAAVAATAPDVSFRGDAAYLLVGGLGGLGRAVSNWMIEHGARNLIYLGRRAGKNAEDESFFAELRSQGCSVTSVQGSITNLGDVERAIAAAPVPLKGVMNLSMVLRDQGFANMTRDEWMAAVEPKVRGTWNLHNACLAAGAHLDVFVMFSSISGIAGQRGQANYASGNTFLDAFVQYRQSLGLVACTVDIGMMVDHGYVADNPALLERIQNQGLFGIRVPELLDALATVIRAPPAKHWGGNGSFVSPAQLVIGMRSLTPLTAQSNRVHWKHDRRMAVYFNESSGDSESSASGVSSTSGALAAFVGSAMTDPTTLSLPDTAVFIAKQIAKQLAALLLRPVEDEADIDVSRSLQDIGLDSLVAIEMRSWWKSVFGFDISVLEMLGIGSLLALGERAVEGLLAKVEAESGKSVGHVKDGVKKVDVGMILETKMP